MPFIKLKLGIKKTLTSFHLRQYCHHPTRTDLRDKWHCRKYLHIYSRLTTPACTTLFHSNCSFTEDERRRILDWLSDVSFKKHHEFYKSLRSQGTCEWLLKKDSFRNWNESDSSSILWLHGIGKNIVSMVLFRAETNIIKLAGSGKTTLA